MNYDQLSDCTVPPFSAAAAPAVLNIKFYANTEHSLHGRLVIAPIFITMLSDGSVVYRLNPLEL